MKNIEFEQLVLFHKKIVANTGGGSGVRDTGLETQDFLKVL